MTRHTAYLRRALLFALLSPAAVAVSAQPTAPDAFQELAGEYRGTVKQTQVTVWATPIAVPGGGEAAVLLQFPETERQALLTRLELLTGDQEALYRLACADARISENGYGFYSAFSRIWQSGGGLVFIYSGPGRRGLLGSGWRSVTAKSGLLMNQEYMSLRGREYMVRQVKRDPRTGKLSEVQLTQTGFIQNFFDNPTLALAAAEAPAGVLDLIREYVNAKYAAMESLQVGGGGLPTDPAAICR